MAFGDWLQDELHFRPNGELTGTGKFSQFQFADAALWPHLGPRNFFKQRAELNEVSK